MPWSLLHVPWVFVWNIKVHIHVATTQRQAVVSSLYSQTKVFIPFWFQSCLFDICTENTLNQAFLLPVLQWLLFDRGFPKMGFTYDTQPTERAAQTCTIHICTLLMLNDRYNYIMDALIHHHNNVAVTHIKSRFVSGGGVGRREGSRGAFVPPWDWSPSPPNELALILELAYGGCPHPSLEHNPEMNTEIILLLDCFVLCINLELISK